MGKNYSVWKCLDCDKLFEDANEALECCNESEEVTAYQCTKCNEKQDDESDANACCESEKIQECEVE